MRAVNDGDVEYVIQHSTEDVTIVAARSAVEGPLAGHEGVRRFFADNADSFEVFRIAIEEMRDLGDGRVLAIGTIHIRGNGGGVETDIPTAGITTFRDGKLSRWEDMRERSLAIAAAGLAE